MLGLLILLYAGSSAHAQGFAACKTETAQYCANFKEAGQILGCLAKEDSHLSEACKDDLKRAIQGAKQAAARGGGALGAFGGMTSLSAPIPMAVYEGRYTPGRSGPSLNENRLNLSTPVYNQKGESVSVTLAGGLYRFSDPLAADNGDTFKKDWYRAEVGVGYSKFTADKKMYGVKVSAGSASDTFALNDLTYSGQLYYGFPGSDPHGYWILALFFANNSQLANGIPIPGAFYIYKTADFTGLFGFPVDSIQWSFARPFSLAVSIFGPILISEIDYGEPDQVQLFTGFSWNRTSFIPHDRVDDKDRFTIEDQKVMIGARSSLFGNVSTEIQVGDSFHRSVYIGTGLSKSERGLSSLPSSVYFGWNLRASL